MKKIYKHRIALLIGVLVALVFFYLGVNRWLETQRGISAMPPPIVRSKEPIQIKPESPEVSADTSEVEEAEEDLEDTVAGVEEPQTVRVVSAGQNEVRNAREKQEQKAQPKKEKTNPEKREGSKAKKVKKPLEKKPEKKSREKIVIKTFEQEFVIQIGAFKKKENAEAVNKRAKGKGLESFIIEEEGLYKVRIRKMGSSRRDALKDIKREFPDAFVVR